MCHFNGPLLPTQLAHNAMITSSWRQNDVATLFWRHNDVAIASFVRWVYNNFIISSQLHVVMIKQNNKLKTRIEPTPPITPVPFCFFTRGHVAYAPSVALTTNTILAFIWHFLSLCCVSGWGMSSKGDKYDLQLSVEEHYIIHNSA